MKQCIFYLITLSTILLSCESSDESSNGVIDPSVDTTDFSVDINSVGFLSQINFADSSYRELWEFPHQEEPEYDFTKGEIIDIKEENCLEVTRNPGSCTEHYHHSLHPQRPKSYMSYYEGNFSRKARTECTFVGPDRMRALLVSNDQYTKLVSQAEFISSFGEVDTEMEAVLIAWYENLLNISHYEIFEDPLEALTYIEEITKVEDHYEIKVDYTNVKIDSAQWNLCYTQQRHRTILIFEDQSFSVSEDQLISEEGARECTTCDGNQTFNEDTLASPL